MSQVLTLELSDEMYTFLKQQAEVAGVSISEWITTSVEQQSGLQKKQQTEVEKEAARQRFRHHAGAIDLGYPTAGKNESSELPNTDLSTGTVWGFFRFKLKIIKDTHERVSLGKIV